MSPPRPDAEVSLVAPDDPIFDPRFRNLAREDLQLTRFWRELPPESRAAAGEVALRAGTIADLVERVRDGVVNLYTRVLQQREARIGIEPAQLLPFRIPIVSRVLEVVPFTVPIPFRTEAFALGSGFVINDEGYLLTNAHVVRNATDIRVVRAGRREEIPARIIGIDPVTDTALLRMEPRPDLTVLPLGDSGALRVGELVIAVGNPLGLNHTVTSGLVSAKERVVPGEETLILDFLQTDSAINPGSSGGPLLNLRGEVVGINTAIVEAAQAIGFAIPIDTAKAVMPLLVLGKSERGWFGAAVRPFEPGEASQAAAGEPEGIPVGEVAPDSPAEAAGLRVGDVITSVNGAPVDGFIAFRRQLLPLLPGDELALGVRRDSERLELHGKLAEPPE